MPRFLQLFGVVLGSGGVLAGAALIISRYGVYSESLKAPRGPFAPMLWQLSLATGLLAITLSALIGFLLFMLGRTLARVERLETAQGGPIHASRQVSPSAPEIHTAQPAESATRG